ncbi:8-oxo-dGTP diphosphatase [Cryptotrichosporon argae]
MSIPFHLYLSLPASSRSSLMRPVNSASTSVASSSRAPRCALSERPIESLVLPLKPESLQCLYHFLAYKRVELGRPIPRSRTAAVAVILFVGRLGDLYVLLSTRAGGMRTYASDTALPGGKYEDGDVDEEGTATLTRQIGLPLDRDKVRLLCLLDPFLTGHSLIVTPAVLLVTDNSLNPLLNPAEVAHLFAMPLLAFLESRPSRIPGWHYGLGARVAAAVRSGRFTPTDVPEPPEVSYADGPGEVGGRSASGAELRPADKGHRGDTGERERRQDRQDRQDPRADRQQTEARYWQYRDVEWGRATVRMHRFLTGREGDGVKPVYGLTAAILIHAASVGYARPPSFPLLAPGQRTMRQRIADDVRAPNSALRRAVEDEGMLGAWLGGDEDGVGGAGGGGDRADERPGADGARAKL